MVSSLQICAGPRATEEALLAGLEVLVGEAERDPALLCRPVRVVVPSKSLREHLAAALVRRRGRSAAGVVIETLSTLARGVLERAGEKRARGEVALEILARRFAASQPSLAPLGELADGRGAVVASVADFLDAGLTPHHLPALWERLDDLPRRGLAHAAEVRRAGEIAAVAAATAAALAELGLTRQGTIFARAAELLALEPRLLPARVLFIHGFTNATGVALDLLEILCRQGAVVFLDLPGDRAAEGEPAGLEFAARLAERLSGRPVAELARLRGEEPEPPRLGLRVAASPAAEVRAAVAEVRELLGAGILPERIGLVARDLSPYRLGLGAAFRRAALPFSAPSAEAPPAGDERRLTSFLERLAARGRPRAALSRQLAGLARQGEREGLELTPALDWLREELPGELEVDGEELTLLFGKAVEAVRDRPLGGRGGGVQVLSATEARGRTFEHLILLGLNRHLFPRRVTSDALLPDGLRQELRTLLPDLPVKGEGHAEERYLFAQLAAAAPRVTLSVHEADDAGEPRTASPLLARLRLAGVLPEPTRAPRPGSVELLAEGDLPLTEGAALAALAAGRGALAVLLPLALPAPLADFRCRLLDEVDPDLRTSEGRARARRLGPFFGFVGQQVGAEAVAVTELEALARCSWQALLTRRLKLATPVDTDLAAAGLDPLLVGEVVHAVAERWAAKRGRPVRRSLAEVLAGGAAPVSWPAPAELSAWSEEAAARVAKARGIPILARPLALTALSALEVAGRELGANVELLGAELEGEAVISTDGGEERVRFRADLAEASATGLVLTDLKSGRPRERQKSEERRMDALLKQVAAGERLQVAVYAAAGGVVPIAGRYLFLGRPERDEEPRQVALAPGVADAALARAVGTLAEARREGAYLPRLKDPTLEKNGAACASCSVFAACSQNDSVATERLRRFVAAARAGEVTLSPAEAAALATFELAAGGGENP